jgi:hypothetical protein
MGEGAFHPLRTPAMIALAERPQPARPVLVEGDGCRGPTAEEAGGVAPPASHRSGRKPLDLSGSYHPRRPAGLPPPPPGSSRCRLALRSSAGDPPPSLPGRYPSSPLLRGGPPLASASVLSASRVHRLGLFPWHRWEGSHVPYPSPDASHAACTPDTTWPVSR